MSDPFIGEIRQVGFNFAPRGWLQCNGAILSIAQYDTLFSLLGTTYGGDGQNTFGLPDLRGRVPIHFGTGPGLQAYVQGQPGGAETVTLTASTTGSHTHAMAATGAGSSDSPQNNFFATVVSSQSGSNAYDSGAANVALVGTSILPSGASQAHANIQPTLAATYIIATEGIYPQQN